MVWITINLSEQENAKVEMYRISRGLPNKQVAVKKMIGEKKIRIQDED
jgi:hypothetical protein